MKKMLLWTLCLVFSVSISYNLFSQNLTEGFEGLTVPPAGWTIRYANANPPAGNLMIHTDAFAHEGTRSFRFSSFDIGAPYDQYLITPRLVTTVDNRTISFYYRRFVVGAESFRIGWSTTGTNIEDFLWSPNITNATEAWQQYVRNDLPVGDNVYFCIHYRSNFSYYLYIDTVAGPATSLLPAPAVNLSPLHLATAVSTNATLNWRAGDDVTTGYDVYFGSELPDEPNSVNQIQTSYNPGALDFETTYYWKIVPRNQFGAATNCPVWQFTTHGDIVVREYPYHQSFESEVFPPTGWTQQLHFGVTQWIRATGGFHNNTNPVGAADGDFNARYYGSANRFNRASLFSPPFDVSELDGVPQLLFTHAQAVWGRDQDSLRVYYKASYDDEWQLLARYRDNIPAWTERSFYIPQATDMLFLRFEAIANYGYGVVLDNIRIQAGPNVIAPSNLTVTNISATRADLGWRENATSTIWDIELGLFGFEPTGVPTARGVTNNPYRYENLQPSTRYEFYVRADGGEDGFSEWVGPQSFMTSQIPAILPLIEGFEGDNQWSLINTDQTNKWAIGTATAAVGQRSAYISTDGGINNVYNINTSSKVHIFRDILFPEEAGDDFELSFWWKGMGEGEEDWYYDYMTVHLVEPNIIPIAGTAVTQGRLGGILLMQRNWRQEVFNLPAAQYQGLTKRLIFTWHNDSSVGEQPPVAIDNIIVREPPEEPPTHAVLRSPEDRGENIALNTVLRWLPGDIYTTSYDVYFGNPLPAQPNSANQTENVFNPGYLEPETTYFWKIVPRNQYGSAVDCPVWSFTTGADISITQFPWNESFEREEFPPLGWQHENVVGITDWIRVTDNTNPNGAADGDANALFDAGADIGHTSFLITPPIDLRNLTNPQLLFWHAQQVWAGDQDSLKVFYRGENDADWRLLASFTNNIPEWTLRRFNLPSILGRTVIKFEAYGGYGYGVALDNVTVVDLTAVQIPWNESFEGELFPPMGWTQEIAVGNTDWIRVTDNTNPDGAADGDANALFNAGANRGHISSLITPPLDLRLVANPQLSFWHAQEEWGGDQDSLKVYYRGENDDDWRILATYTDDIPEWTLRRFNLPENLGTALIKFEAYGDWGYGVVIDDVTVTGETVAKPEVNISIVNGRIRLTWEPLDFANSYRIIFSYSPSTPINEWIEAAVVEETEYIENIGTARRKFFRVIGLGDNRQRTGRLGETGNRR